MMTRVSAQLTTEASSVNFRCEIHSGDEMLELVLSCTESGEEDKLDSAVEEEDCIFGQASMESTCN